MRVVKSIKNLRALLNKEKLKNKSVGFVPTMGAFHEGHLSLMRRCKKEHDICVVSVFVNHLQFPPKEDFNAYPRNKKHDERLAKNENVDIIFYPSVKEMYPESCLTYIEVEYLGNILCGKNRPGHFKGVTTVVGKLLNIVNPQTCYLGEKDWQQLIILKNQNT